MADSRVFVITINELFYSLNISVFLRRSELKGSARRVSRFTAATLRNESFDLIRETECG
jgi:hypothetical protein